MTRDEIVEAMARVIMETHRDTDCNEWEHASRQWKAECSEVARAQLSALEAKGLVLDG